MELLLQAILEMDWTLLLTSQVKYAVKYIPSYKQKVAGYKVTVVLVLNTTAIILSTFVYYFNINLGKGCTQ